MDKNKKNNKMVVRKSEDIKPSSKKQSNLRKVRKIDKDDGTVKEEVVAGKGKKKNHKKGWKIFRICLFVFIALCIIGAGVVLGVITGVIDKTENIDIEDLNQTLTSFVYDKDGNEVAAFHGEENRVNTEYKDIPKGLVDAIVSIEDERFFQHKGVDVKRTAGAIVTFVLNGGKSNFGGSTLTQQLVKNVTDDKESSWTRKIREWYRAMTLETKMSKEEIFAAYVNTVYLGDHSYGVVVASENYFGKELKDITIAEAACLAANIQSPEATNPYKSEQAKQKLLDRQKIVLNKMHELGKITDEEYEQAKNQEIVFKKEVMQQTTDVQSYFVDAVYEAVKKDLMEQKNITASVAQTMLYGGGLKIYSTLDQGVQKAIDEAYDNQKLFYANKDGSYMQSAMVVIEQSSGSVRGLIGGADKKTGARSLNRATQLPRQPGSCMKPIGAYGPAFEQGISSPGAGLDDAPLQGAWQPGNYYAGFNGYVTVRQAVAKSMNLPAIRANQKVGADYAFNFAKNMGLKSLVKEDKTPASLAIGGLTNGVTVMEMANAYATMANKGIYIEPKLYTKVVDRNGKEILSNEKSTAKKVMKDSTAFMLTSCMEEVVKTGTAAGYVKAGNMAIAGKTGNTDNDFDQWFCGYTPYYTIACWNGYDKNKTIGYRTWGNYPYTSVKLFNTVVNSISKGQQPKQFEQPDSVVKVPLCKVSGLVATDACRADPRGDQTGTDFVAKDSIPTATCNIHKMVKICNQTGQIANQYCPSTTNKSFISRDYDPNPKPSDWSYMLPTATCTVHNSSNQAEKPNNGGNSGGKDDVVIY